MAPREGVILGGLVSFTIAVAQRFAESRRSPTTRPQVKVNTAGLSTDDLERLRQSEPSKRISPRNRTKADILVYPFGDTSLAVKDYSARPWIVRNTLGRYLLRRECTAYRAAGEVEGLPRFLGRIDRFALATAWIDARPLAHCSSQEIPAGFFDRLQSLVEQIHGRGVALADLHHRDVLVSRCGAVHIVDLAAAWTTGAHPGRLRRAIFERLCDQDHIALARMRARFGGEDEQDAIDAVGARAAARYRRARMLKALLDRMRGRKG